MRPTSKLRDGLRLAVVDQADLGGGAAHVERQDAASARSCARDAARQGWRRRPDPIRPGGPESASPSRASSAPPPEVIRQQRAGEAGSPAAARSAGRDSVPSAAGRRRWRRWSRSARTRGSPAQTSTDSVIGTVRAAARRRISRDAPLVVGIGVSCAGSRSRRSRSACAAARGDSAAHGRLVERQQHVALAHRCARAREAQAARHQRRRLLDEDVVLLEAVLVADLERVAKAFGGDQRRPRALALDQRVGGERRAVDDEVDRRRRDARPRDDARACPPSTPASGAARRGEHLGRERRPPTSSATSVNVPPISTPTRTSPACVLIVTPFPSQRRDVQRTLTSL